MESHGESFLRQLSVGSSPSNLQSSSARGSRRWRSSSSTTKKKNGSNQMDGGASSSHSEMRLNLKKRVMVVIDESSRAKHAMMWALTHIANKGDHLTLLHVVPPPSHHHSHSHSHSHHHREYFGPNLANSLGSLCKSCKPEVEVEALVIQGPKLATVLSQVKKLEASVLVLSQSKTSPFSWSSSEDFVEQCINKAECLALAVRKQSKGVGGYLVSSKWQKNFWLLA